MKNLDFQSNNKFIIGMVHIEALPGTPRNKLSISKIIEKAVSEANKLQQAGVDSILIENMHDVPYLKRKVGPEITASMTAVAIAIRNSTDLPMGIQVLAGANKEAIAVAQASNLQFIRAEGFIFGHLADEGFMESDAGELLRYRKMIGAEDIKIFTDIQKKHSSHSISSDLSLSEHVKTAEYFLSDGIIITGKSTGESALINDVITAKENTKLPVIIGSGITAENISEYWDFADAFIIGSSIKYDGNWKNDISSEKLNQLINKINQLRN